jgi:hypothetical protein
MAFVVYYLNNYPVERLKYVLDSNHVTLIAALGFLASLSKMLHIYFKLPDVYDVCHCNIRNGVLVFIY